MPEILNASFGKWNKSTCWWKICYPSYLHRIWQILTSFLLFCNYFTGLSWWNKLQNMRHSKNIFLGVAVIATALLHSTKPELRFCAGSNPARGISEIPDDEDLWQWSHLGQPYHKRIYHKLVIRNKWHFWVVTYAIKSSCMLFSNNVCLIHSRLKAWKRL